MCQYITDIEGDRIEITDLPEAIKQAEMFSTFDVHDKERTEYWKHMLGELQNLKPLPEPKTEMKVESKYPEFVNEARLYWGVAHIGHKAFIKNGRKSPLYPSNSCARSESVLRQIEALEIGESTNNTSPTKITRIF
jgi:hypothetical protein